jgi:subtilase family serine protease
MNGFRAVSSNPDLNGVLTVTGGTSSGAPTFAGIVALINQKMGSAQGNVNYVLYPLAAASSDAIHDITTGNNIVPCTSGSTGCPSGGEIGYSATSGFDQASGLGSIDAYHLVEEWSLLYTSTMAPTLSVPSSGATGVSTTPTFGWTTVPGNAGYRIMVATSSAVLPIGSSVVTCSGCTINTITSAASYTPASALAVSTTYYWQVQALSSTSGVYGTWSTVSSFTTVVPDFSLSASPSSLTMKAGTNATSTLTLTPINNFSGSPSFTCSASSSLAGVTCSVGALNSNNTATVMITASSSASTFPAPQKNRPFTGWPVAALAAACLLLMVLITLRQRDSQTLLWRPCVRQVALVAMLACLLAVMLSCGGGSGGGGGGSTTTPESGTVTVQGTGPTTSHSVSISVTVD